MELLNQEKINQLAGEIGEENIPVLLDIFLDELLTYARNLADGSQPDRLDYLKEISHALKSSAASFGAEALYAHALEIDTKVKQGTNIDEPVEVEHMVGLLHKTHSRYSQLVG